MAGAGNECSLSCNNSVPSNNCSALCSTISDVTSTRLSTPQTTFSSQPSQSIAYSTNYSANYSTPIYHVTDPFWDQIPFALPYWRQFDFANVAMAYHYAVALWITFFGIMGITGNALVIWIFLRLVSAQPCQLISW